MAVTPFQLPVPLTPNTRASAAAVVADIEAAAVYGASAVNTQLSPQAVAALTALGVVATTADAAVIALAGLIAGLSPSPPSGGGGDSDFSQPGNSSQLPLMSG